VQCGEPDRKQVASRYYLCRMSVLRSLRWKWGLMQLKREDEPLRNRHGANFVTARKVGILYKDTDEPAFNRIRAFARSVKEDYQVHSVISIGFVDQLSTHLPVWQQKKLEFDFISLSDLNWCFRPVRNVSSFQDHSFDLLIDLSGGNEVPLGFLLKESKSAMKVGWKSSFTEPYCDLVIDMKGSTSVDLFIQQLKLYLGNPKIV
jgi:hypothetical protein